MGLAGLVALAGGPGGCAPNPVDRVAVERTDVARDLSGDVVPGPDVIPGDDGAPEVNGAGGAGGMGTGGAASGGMMGTGGMSTGGSPVPEPAPDLGGPEVNGAGGTAEVGPPEVAPEVTPGEAGARGLAFLVVGAPGALAATDKRLELLLTASGFTVKVGDDDAPATQVDGSQVVVLSGTCESTKLLMKYRATAIPTMVLEPLSFDEMAMTAAGGDNGHQNGNALAIVAADHPLAAQLTGTVVVLTGATAMCWGKPLPTAELVANVGGMAGKAGIFGYKKGVMMAGVLAPDKRIGFFASMAAVPNLNPTGEKLFAAALDWLTTP